MLSDRADMLTALVVGACLAGAALAYADLLRSPAAVARPGAGHAETGGIDPARLLTLAERLQPGRAASRADTPRENPLREYRIIGLVESEGTQLLLVTGPGGTQSLSPGMAISGYVLISIEEGRALFAADEDRIHLDVPGE